MAGFFSRTLKPLKGTASLFGSADAKFSGRGAPGGETGSAWGPVLFLGCLGSGGLTVLQLCAALYTLAVYDLALPSRDTCALVMMTGVALGLHLAFCLLDLARSCALSRAGFLFARRLEWRALRLLEADRRRGLAALGEVDRIASYLSTAGPLALLDAVWLPASLVLITLLHPALALFAGCGTLLLVSVSLAADARWRKASRGVLEARLTRFTRVSSTRGSRGNDWRARALSRSYYRRCVSAGTTAVVAGAVVKGLRLSLQSLGFGLGALLVIEGCLSIGELFAWSLIASRLFASLDAVLAHARGHAAACDSYASLVAMGIATEITMLGGQTAGAQILNSSMFAKAVRSASDQAPESFLK